MTYRNRRSFVAGAAFATMGLAGCLSTVRERGADGDDDDDDGDDEPSRDESIDEGTDVTTDLPGEAISDFEDLGEWVAMIDRGEVSVAESDPYAGTQSALLTAGEDVDYAAAYRSFSGGIDLSGKNLSLAVKYTGRDQLMVSLELLAPNPRNDVRFRRTLTGPTDRWVRVDFGPVRARGDPDLTEVREIRLTAHRRGDQSGSIECHVDDLRAADGPETGSVLFLFDGTLASHHTHALEAMNEYGYAGVEAVIPEAIGGNERLTIDQMEDLSDAGWDMAARPRTGTNHLHDYDLENQEHLIKATKTFLEDRGFEGAEAFVTPRDFLGPRTIDLVREYHEVAFRYGGGPNGLPLTDPINAGVFAGHAGAETKQYVDLAAEYGGLAVCHFEHVGDDGISVADFEALLEHVDRQDVNVVTATDLIESS